MIWRLEAFVHVTSDISGSVEKVATLSLNVALHDAAASCAWLGRLVCLPSEVASASAPVTMSTGSTTGSFVRVHSVVGHYQCSAAQVFSVMIAKLLAVELALRITDHSDLWCELEHGSSDIVNWQRSLAAKNLPFTPCWSEHVCTTLNVQQPK